jgi:uncharacterized membrane protein YGL010W
MRDIYQWNNEYGKYHKNKTNKLIHWLCVPLIMFSIFGLLSLSNFSYELNPGIIKFDFLNIFIILSLFFYVKLSIRLSIGMLLISMIFYFIVIKINQSQLFTNFQLGMIYALIFTIAWIGQFIGHKIEGKKPAFFTDLQFLLIGPIWLLSFIYNKFNIKLK